MIQVYIRNRFGSDDGIKRDAFVHICLRIWLLLVRMTLLLDRVTRCVRPTDVCVWCVAGVARAGVWRSTGVKE
jgi:hypothetical protein